MNGVIKHWFDMEQHAPHSALDHEFIQKHTTGIQDLKQHVTQLKWEDLEASSGLSKERMKEFATLLANANSGVFIWSMGLTQHRFATDNISQVANLAMLRGFIGRKHCGVMPIRGHSGVKVLVKWVLIHSFCRVVILMKRILKESNVYGGLTFLNGMVTPLGNPLRRWLSQKTIHKNSKCCLRVAETFRNDAKSGSDRKSII